MIGSTHKLLRVFVVIRKHPGWSNSKTLSCSYSCNWKQELRYGLAAKRVQSPRKFQKITFLHVWCTAQFQRATAFSPDV